MSRDMAHPALHTPPLRRRHKHFVPEGWETLDRGCCPCGEVVVWDENRDRWQPDRTMRVLVLTPAEIKRLPMIEIDILVPTIGYQLELQNEVQSYEQN